MEFEYISKNDKCKCGRKLILTQTKPAWVYCEFPYCDYVVMYGDYKIDRIFKTYSESKFIKEGPDKGKYQGSPVSIYITDIKPNYIWK